MVGIVMGSDSDLPVMSQAAEVLEQLGLPVEVGIVSAHRTPRRMYDYAAHAAERGIQVIIAGAGGAAHLPGMIASLCNIPVIGVPVRSSNLQGLDSLLSIVQMPSGIPVATVAINGARNAGILAARILAISSPELEKRLETFTQEMSGNVEGKISRLDRGGWRNYLKDMESGSGT